MPEELSVLLVYDQDETVCGAERIFQSCRIRFKRARNCFEAREVLRGPAAPRVVVTDLALSDGDWTDILRAANAAPAKTPVIVASRLLDIKLYLDVLDSGAHDFVVPPFSSSDLAYIIRTAIQTDRSFPSQSLGRDDSPEGQETPTFNRGVLAHVR
jgi:DNA-binding NtrC family response regulator